MRAALSVRADVPADRATATFPGCLGFQRPMAAEAVSGGQQLFVYAAGRFDAGDEQRHLRVAAVVQGDAELPGGSQHFPGDALLFLIGERIKSNLPVLELGIKGHEGKSTAVDSLPGKPQEQPEEGRLGGLHPAAGKGIFANRVEPPEDPLRPHRLAEPGKGGQARCQRCHPQFELGAVIESKMKNGVAFGSQPIEPGIGQKRGVILGEEDVTEHAFIFE